MLGLDTVKASVQLGVEEALQVGVTDALQLRADDVLLLRVLQLRAMLRADDTFNLSLGLAVTVLATWETTLDTFAHLTGRSVRLPCLEICTYVQETEGSFTRARTH